MTASATLPGIRKAAILIQQLTQEISELHYVTLDTALQVLEEYSRLALTQDYVAQGGWSRRSGKKGHVSYWHK